MTIAKPIWTEPVNVTNGQDFTLDMWNMYVEQNLAYLHAVSGKLYAKVWLPIGSQQMTVQNAGAVVQLDSIAEDDFSIIESLNSDHSITLEDGVYRFRWVISSRAERSDSITFGMYYANQGRYLGGTNGHYGTGNENNDYSAHLHESIGEWKLASGGDNDLYLHYYQNGASTSYINGATLSGSTFRRGYLEIWRLPEDYQYHA